MMKEFTIRIIYCLSLLIGISACDNNSDKATGEQIVQSIREDISVEKAYEMIKNSNHDENLVLIDVRTPQQYEQVHLQNTILINYRDPNFKTEISKLDKNRTYIVHCRSGKRSGKACEIMQETGFKEVYNVAGGILEWQEVDLPVVRLSN